jgi:outer membrane protein, heavy metal efflux system
MMILCNKNWATLIFTLLLNCSLSKGQGVALDTIKITLPQADSLFLSKNLLLLAQKYNISENEAYALQAKIWDLPNLTINHNAYNPDNRKFFEISSGSETSVQIEQLILIGGKRSNLVTMAQTNTQIAQYQYMDLLRSLKFQLRSAFYNVYFTEQKLKIYDTELPILKQIITGYEAMYPKGFVSLKEVVRLKALLFSLEKDKLDLLQQYSDNEDTIRLIINEKSPHPIKPVPDLVSIDSVRPDQFVLSAFIDTALRNRFDLLVLQSQNLYAKTDLSYQKSLNIPNPTLIAGWDHNGSFVRNYNYLGFSIDLPFWNKNKGNIRAAESRIDANKALYDNYELQVTTQVSHYYSKALQIDLLYRNTDSKYGDDFTRIIKGTTENFLKHQIGLLEFVDLYESYKDSQTQLIQLQNDRINAIENLYYVTGKSMN